MKDWSKYTVIAPDAEIDSIDSQLRLLLGDALTLRDDPSAGSWDCLFAHFERLFDLTTVEGLLNEFVNRAAGHDGLDDNDIPMETVLAGMEKVLDTIAFWSKIDSSYTPEVRAHQTVLDTLETYRAVKGVTQ